MHALLTAALLLSGGVVPGATFGGTGVQGDNVNYVALPHTIQVVRRGTGEVNRWRSYRRAYGIPVAAYDGSVTGLSGDEQTLVLSEVSNEYPPKRSRMVVLNPFDLRPRSRIDLPGVYTVHALSPDGRFIYLVRYPDPIRDLDRHELAVYDDENPGTPETIERAMGTPLSRVEDGDLVYTLYGPNEPFIRVLDTVNRAVKRIALHGLLPADVTSMRLRRATHVSLVSPVPGRILAPCGPAMRIGRGCSDGWASTTLPVA
jgi:hypothetical protein